MPKPKKLMGVQQILLRLDKETEAILKYLCEQSGKLYNNGVYFARQTFFKTGKILTGKFDIEIPVINERQRQTYFGALNYYTQEFLIKPYNRGDSSSAIAFVKYLISQYPKSRIALIWDGASYHRSAEFQAYLNTVNCGLNESEWKVTCIRFAPNDPTQNPVEDIWLQAKNFLREFYHLCKSFTQVKRLFELVTHHQVFDFPKLFMYG